MIPTVQFPINFLELSEYRRLAFETSRGDIGMKLWFEFAHSQTDFRPLDIKVDQSIDEVDWKNDSTVWQIENFCDAGGNGDFIKTCLKLGIMTFDIEAGRAGLRLKSFAECNPQFFKKGAARGGLKKGANSGEKEANAIASNSRQLELLLPDSEDQPARERMEFAHSILNQVRRALGMDAVLDHPEDQLTTAIDLAGSVDRAEVKTVCVYLMANRENPHVDKRIPVILKNFTTYKDNE